MFRKSFLRGEESTVLDAIRILDEAATGLVLVVDRNDRLIGVVSDGDIRRGFLKGLKLDSSVGKVLVRTPYCVSQGTSRAQVLDIMKARRFSQVPIVDDTGKVVGLHLLNELILGVKRPNVAVVMAGGKGERLGALTKDTPKPMLPVAGRPILERIVLHLISHGITEIFLAVNYLKDVIKEHFDDGSRFGCHIHYLEESIPLGSGGPLSLLPPQQHSVVVMNGDLVTDVNISRLLDYHEQNHFYATMGYTAYKQTIPFGCLEVEDGKMTGLLEKPTIFRNVNAGIYALSPEAVRSVPANQYYMITNIFGKALEEKRPCGAYPVGSDWIDVGVPKDLARAKGTRT